MALSSSKRRKARFLLGGLLASSLLACNALIGISDYDRGECSGGGICTSMPTEAGPPTDGGKDTSTDAPIILTDAAGSRPVSWARFVMPNYAQDGGPTDNVATTYTEVTGGLIDPLTERVWHQPAPSGTKSYADAEKFCADLTFPDGSKWRLPSRIELVTLLDLSRTPKIHPLFQGTESGEYWTFSEVRRPDGAGVTGERWTVNFESGVVGKKSGKDGKAAVRCIKGQ